MVAKSFAVEWDCSHIWTKFLIEAELYTWTYEIRDLIPQTLQRDIHLLLHEALSSRFVDTHESRENFTLKWSSYVHE